MPGNILTAAEARAAAKAMLTQAGSPISPDVCDLATSNAGLLCDAAASTAVLVSSQLQTGLAGLYLGTARGADLDFLVLDRYDMVRMGASPSVGEVVLTRPTFTYGSITVPAGTTILAGDVTLTTTVQTAFGAMDIGPHTVPCQSNKGGSDQGVLAGTPCVVQGLGDTSIIGTISTDFSGAADIESDSDLAARARSFWLAARRGTLGAVYQGLLSTPGVYRATVNEFFDPDVTDANYIEAFIADRSGRANDQLVALAQTTLLEWRPAGIEVRMNTSIPVYQDISVTVQFQAGTDTADKRDATRTALMALVNGLAPGGTLYLADIYRVLTGMGGLIVSAGAVVEPVGDVVPAAGECIRTTADRVLVNGG